MLRVLPPAPEQPDLQPLEAEALAALYDGSPITVAMSALTRTIRPRFEALELELRRQGVLTSPEQKRPFRLLFFAALVAVPGLGLLKFLVALSRGKSNVGFLVLLGIVFTLACLPLRAPWRTAAGDRYLAWLRQSYQGLRGRDQGSAHPGELALAAGIFGIAALPVFLDLKRAFHPRPQSGRVSGSSCSSGSDSSGSDSGGSSCSSGSSCGGGGCGGCGGS